MTKRWRRVVLLLAFAGVAAGPTQGPDVQQLMREKLEHSQQILAAVVTNNWVELELHSRELERVTDDPRWMVLKVPEYARYSLAFKHAAQTLREAAARREPDATPIAYASLTLTCVQCHRYLARAGVTE